MKKNRYELIKLRKKVLGFKTQLEFGKALGYSKTHISNLELGKSNPSTEFMERLEKYCDDRGIKIQNMWEVFKKGE